MRTQLDITPALAVAHVTEAIEDTQGASTGDATPAAFSSEIFQSSVEIFMFRFNYFPNGRRSKAWPFRP